MLRLLRIAGPALGLLATAACAVEPTGAARTSLVGAEDDTETDSAVAILIGGSRLCTGTVISPHVVLTAKHCVQDPGADAPMPPEMFEVRVGASIGAPDQSVDVVLVTTTPGSWSIGAGGGTDGLIGFDVAVLNLAEPVSAPPLPYRRERARGTPGRTFTVWGYGAVPDGGNGIRRRADVVVSSATTQIFLTPPSVCSGDSGGPLFDPDAGDVIGVASLGPDVCGTAEGAFNTLHPYVTMIDGAIFAAGDCGVVECSDAGVPEDAGTAPDASLIADSGAVMDDAGASGSDATITPPAGSPGGGGCSASGAGGVGGPAALAWLGFVALLRRGRRRRPSLSCRG